MKRQTRVKRSRQGSDRALKSRLYRGITALVIGLVGCGGVIHTAAYQIRSSDAALAHRLAPYDGRITALAAAFLSNPTATSEDRRNADELAKSALRQDATAVVAASTLGLNAQVSDHTAAARRFFNYSQLLSRREMQTQLWAIEDAVARGNVVGALKHYDTALRLTPSLSEMLFPVLMSASTDDQIRAKLAITLASNPSWAEHFIIYTATNNPDPRSTKKLFSDLHKIGFSVPGTAQTILINALINLGLTDDAWNYYASLRSQADRRVSRDPHFGTSTETASLFDWNLSLVSGINTSIQSNGSHGLFDFAVPAMLGGTLLQQLQLLPPGNYQLTGHSIGIEQTVAARPYWTLKCLNGSELGRVPVTNSREANGNFFGTLRVPTGCPVQILSLIAQPSEAVSGVAGQIDFLQMQPARQAAAAVNQ